MSDEAGTVRGRLRGAGGVRPPRWVGPAFLTMWAILVPWIIYLSQTLPQRQVSPHYRTAWVGFDVILLSQIGRTGVYALRERWAHRVQRHAAMCSALLFVDAWFDVTTSRRRDMPMSLTLALLVELPLAGLCWWLAVRQTTEA